MDLPDKSNSQPAVPKKNIKPVIAGAKAERPATRRFFNFLFAESPKALVGKIGRDVLVPRAKAGVEEALGSFIHGMFWGNTNTGLPSNIVRGTVLRGGGTNYSQISSAEPSALQQAAIATQRTSSGNYRDVVSDTQDKAEILLANMFDLLNRFNVVAVADLYELASITPAPSDNSFGWTSLDGARISKVREGYLLELPRPTLI